MATTDLKLTDAGELPKPGPMGRLVRLALGALCLFYVADLWSIRGNPITDAGHIQTPLWTGIIFGLFLVNYVVNIGFSQSWKKWPAILSGLGLVGVAGISKVFYGEYESTLMAYTLLVWLLYIFTHLGMAFVLAALIQTPGCEMRTFHHLWSLVSGQTTKEHICPIGPLTPIDNWEAARQV
ncbi:hypothetical protein RHODOSMS8_01800 [Rhodobiaceae bacterium]|nr:hypothetical protein RHODOSMS8_01800 [Rhodobiaceae bacterium]